MTKKKRILQAIKYVSEFAKRFTVYIVAILIVLASALEMGLSKEKYSESENRYLAQFPEFSFETLKNGKFTKGLEDYLCDHFPLRDDFMKLYAKVQKLEGKEEINGVYVCKDNYYIEKPKPYENMDKFVRHVNGLASTYENCNVNLMLVPTAITIYKDKLPKNADGGCQLEEIEKVKEKLDSKVNFIDVSETLKKGAEEGTVFYKTDHHWTTLGAYDAFKKYCSDLGLAEHPIDEYTLTEVSKDFYGTISSKVNDKDLKPDKMVSFTKKNTLDINYQNATGHVLYNEGYLKRRDKYSFFLNNINDKIVIKNKKIKEDRKGKSLLVYKDSYANCFIPFLVDEYETIIVLDTRYYMNGGEELVEDYGVTDILVLYNMNTVDTDTGVSGIY
ncbi:DHHW family protein [uncultured Eubacterium sp.]|uniref:DHHW family protein n=1 Tax=uncultured Eubacterium sp. TaxID=165185 RepID=UPI000E84676D|nr:DHHW family protein [uncultured Eubacterium sp.]HAV90892.1 hypothetical protein [Eubacterium sp.]